MKIPFIILVFVCFATSCASQKPTSTYSGITQFLEDAEKNLNFHGTVLLVQNSDTLIYKGYGYSDIKNKVLTNKNTAYNIGSIAKTFAAIGIMKLVEEGKISLQDSLKKFFSDVPADKAPITLHQLLVHQSGIGQHYVADNQETQEKALSKIFKLQLDDAPGKKFIYSNENYTLLGIITERITNTNWEDYIRKTILQPLDMKNTFFHTEYNTINYAKPLQANGKKPKQIRRDYGNIGAAGIFSTPIDMAKFWNAIKTSEILTNKTLKELLLPHIKVTSPLPEVNMYYAYVMFIYQTGSDPLRAVSSRGNTDTWGTAVSYWFPRSNTTLIVLSNKELLLNREKSNIYISNELIRQLSLFE